MFGRDFEVDAWSIFWRWNFIKICGRTCDMTKISYFGILVSWTQPSGPLCLWQCFMAMDLITSLHLHTCNAARNISFSYSNISRFFTTSETFWSLSTSNSSSVLIRTVSSIWFISKKLRITIGIRLVVWTNYYLRWFTKRTQAGRFSNICSYQKLSKVFDLSK